MREFAFFFLFRFRLTFACGDGHLKTGQHRAACGFEADTQHECQRPAWCGVCACVRVRVRGWWVVSGVEGGWASVADATIRTTIRSSSNRAHIPRGAPALQGGGCLLSLDRSVHAA